MSCLAVHGEYVGSPEGGQVDDGHQVLVHLTGHDAQVTHQLPHRVVVHRRQPGQQLPIPAQQ